MKEDSKPNYLKIFEELKVKIRNQILVAGDMLPSDKELGEQYGVSRPTVAKAINLLFQEKLVIRRPGFGTQVAEPGKSTKVVGLLIPHLHETEIFEPICRGIIEFANHNGMQVIRPSELSLSLDRRALAESLTQKFVDLKVNGVFFTPVEHLDDQEAFNLAILERLRAAGIQVVLLDRDVYAWPRQSPNDLVGIDNIEAGYMMTSHLIEKGCQSICFATESSPAMTVQQRIIGSREAFIQHGLYARDLAVFNYSHDEPELAARQILDARHDGVLCANDATAAVLMRALLNLGANIPKQVKVCGFDDVKYASLLSIPLTTYHQPCESIGKVAGKTMLDRILSPVSPSHRITLSGNIVARHSSER